MYMCICMHIPTVTLRFAYIYIGFYIYTRLGVCFVRGFRTRVFCKSVWPRKSKQIDCEAIYHDIYVYVFFSCIYVTYTHENMWDWKMWVYSYIYMHIHTCICLFESIFTRHLDSHTCGFIWLCINTYIANSYKLTHTLNHTYTHTHTRTHTHTHTDTHQHPHITHTHTHTHMIRLRIYTPRKSPKKHALTHTHTHPPQNTRTTPSQIPPKAPAQHAHTLSVSLSHTHIHKRTEEMDTHRKGEREGDTHTVPRLPHSITPVPQHTHTHTHTHTHKS